MLDKDEEDKDDVFETDTSNPKSCGIGSAGFAGSVVILGVVGAAVD